MCRIASTEINWKLKFSIQTSMTHINTIFAYCHASVNLDSVNILYLAYENVLQLCFLLKKLFLV